MIYKQCSTCHETKLESMFKRDPRYKGGLTGQCKACITAINTRNQRIVRELSREPKYCKVCGEKLASRKRIFCSNACAFKYRWKNLEVYKTEEYREAHRKNARAYERRKRAKIKEERSA